MTTPSMSTSMTSGMQDLGVPFDVFIQALTLQLDKAQASMALKARVGKLPLTFAVKDVTLDLRAFVRVVNDDIWVRPAGPGDENASNIKLALTTVTKPMIDENAINYDTQDPKFSIKQSLSEHFSEDDQRRLELIGVHNIEQLQDLRKAAGTDVVARLARMPVNRLQQAMLASSAPHVTSISQKPGNGDAPALVQVGIRSPGLRLGRLAVAKVQGQEVPMVQHGEDHFVLHPTVEQLGMDVDIDFGEGQKAVLSLTDGSLGRWSAVPQAKDPTC